MSLVATVICLIACHGGPADHFATFAEELVKDGYHVQVYASGPALKKFQERKIDVIMPFDVEHLSEQEEINLASRIVKSCSHASVVLTDVGHPFDIVLQKTLAIENPTVLRVAYYDNPECYVKDYSSNAARVMLAANKVWLANANLAHEPLYHQPNAEIPLPIKDRIGLGYYPIAQAETMAQKRAECRDKMRSQLFSKYKLEEKGQKVLVYFGGNNDEYFTKALPAFFSFLSEGIHSTDLSHHVIVIQQHPGAVSKKIENGLIETWVKEHGTTATAPVLILSQETSDDAQLVADGALYDQTSMGPKLILAGIPMIQVNHKTYEDILVRNHLCPSATSASALMQAIANIQPTPVSEEQRSIIFKSLGINKDWYQVLRQALTPFNGEDPHIN